MNFFFTTNAHSLPCETPYYDGIPSQSKKKSFIETLHCGLEQTRIETGVLGHSLVRSLAPLTCSLAPDYLLRSRPPLTCSLAHSLCWQPRLWESELLMSQNDLVLSHSALFFSVCASSQIHASIIREKERDKERMKMAFVSAMSFGTFFLSCSGSWWRLWRGW